MLVVVNGAASADVVEEVQLAREELQRKDCELFGVIVNRVAPDAVDEVERRLAPHTGQEWVYVMPEQAELAYPSVGEVQAALGARPLLAVDGQLDRDVREVRVAAMSAEHFIEDLVEGTLVVVPADRSDIVVACLASTLSPSFPAVSGLLLTGGYPLSPTVRNLLETSPFPVSRSMRARTSPRPPSRASDRCCERRTSAGSPPRSASSSAASTRSSCRCASWSSAPRG